LKTVEEEKEIHADILQLRAFISHRVWILVMFRSRSILSYGAPIPLQIMQVKNMYYSPTSQGYFLLN
jgi:hypothetical protein